MNIEENKIKNKLFKNGLSAFNTKDYYDAHEHWEDLWSDYILEDAKFVQGLIQLAVGYFHISNYNKNGAIGLLTKSFNKFELYSEKHRGIDVVYIMNAINKSLDNLNIIEDIKDFNWSLAPFIKVCDE